MGIKHILTLTLLLSLIAFGQVGCATTDGNKARVIGLDFSLLQEAPPTVLSEGDEFQVVVKIENYGMISTSGEFCVEDTVDDFYGGIGRNCEPFSIGAASEDSNNILPRSEIITLPTSSSSFSYKGLSNQPVNIIYSVIYQYSTQAAPLICVKDPLKQTATSCRTSETISVDVLAPLSITSVEKVIGRISENQVRLTVKINLRKDVNGILLLPGSVSGFEEEENKILVREVSFGPNTLNCNNEGVLEITTEKVLRCSGVINVDGVVKHPLNIVLDYTVKSEKNFDLTIES